MYFSKKRMKNQRLSVVFLLMFGVVGAITVTDDIFWSRITSMVTQVETDATEKETGATRFIFWEGAWDMAKDYPFGQGSRAFLYYSPIYIPSEVDTGKKRNRAVHSTWFEALTEIGYLGLLSLVGVIYYSLSTTKKAAKRLKEHDELNKYFKVVAIRCSLICFIVSMTFLNRLRGEILYWCILYCAIAYNIYYLKPIAEMDRKNAQGT
jgi:O-antigen ligase